MDLRFPFGMNMTAYSQQRFSSKLHTRARTQQFTYEEKDAFQARCQTPPPKLLFGANNKKIPPPAFTQSKPSSRTHVQELAKLLQDKKFWEVDQALEKLNAEDFEKKRGRRRRKNVERWELWFSE
jgi:hypothetical protein